MMAKSIAKTVVQMAATIYVSKLVNKYVGELFDKAFGKTKKGLFS